MGEHLPCKQGVRGSNPLSSTVIEVNILTDNKTGEGRNNNFSGMYLENFIQRDNNKPFIINKTSKETYPMKEQLKGCLQYTSVERQIGSYRKITKKDEIYTTLRIYPRKVKQERA